MKKILIISSILSIVLIVLWGRTAGAVTLEWNANTDDAVVYYVYYGDSSNTYTASEYVAGIDTVKHTLALPDGDWYFAITSIDAAGNESGYSSEVSMNIDTVPPMIPAMLRILP